MSKLARAGTRQLHLSLSLEAEKLLDSLMLRLDTDNASEVVRRAVKLCTPDELALAIRVPAEGVPSRKSTHVRVSDSVGDAIQGAGRFSGTTFSDVVAHALRKLEEACIESEEGLVALGRRRLSLAIDPDLPRGFARGARPSA